MNQLTMATLIVLTTMIGCGPNIAPSPTTSTATGAISGRIIDAVTGAPIAGASIITDPPTTPVTTGPDGSYSISNTQEGTCTVTASKEGYIDATVSIAVTAGQTTIADLHLLLVPTATPTPTPTATPLPIPTPTPLPHLSGSGGGVLAFSDWNGSFTMVNADLSVHLDLPIRQVSFAWSPDGQRLAFAGLDGDIYIVSADGTGMTTLTSTLPTKASAPSWSPDGTLIAFVSGHDLHVVDADGGNQKRLTTGKDVVDTNCLMEACEIPAWSPDGKKIAFVSQLDGNSDISVVNVDGSGLTQLTDSGYDPNWSPDGRNIAFVSDRDGKTEIYLMNSDGSGQTNLTNSQAYDADPDWSPDGWRIVFASHDDSADINKFLIINAGGSCLACLFSTPSYGNSYAEPDWSPDGRHIAFTANNRNQLYVMNADGSNVRCIVCPRGGDETRISQLAWRPE